VLYVVPPAPALARAATEAGDARWAGSSAARRGIVQAGSDTLARTARALDKAGVTYATRLDQGLPAERICQVARDEGYDLVVLSHPRAVRAQDGKAGRLQKIVADPETHEPAYLVVRRSRLSPRDIVIPVGLVTEVTGNTVMLDTTQEALSGFPDYEISVERHEKLDRDYTSPWPMAAPLERARATVTGKFTVRERTVPEHTAWLCTIVSAQSWARLKECSWIPMRGRQGILCCARGFP
jgi:nucleotide-binding universal stress UspA family protein